MASPQTSNGELFFSSSPQETHLEPNPGDEVLLLIARARLTRALPRTIASFLESSQQKTLFKKIFTRQIELLKSRSQAFEDGHVTVYDKTLLNLTHNGNDLDSPAAIVYFCEEFLGINNHGDHTTSQRFLEQSVTLPALLTQEYSPPPTERCSSSLKIEPRIERATPVFSPPPKMEAKLARLWEVYKRAKDDFTEANNGSDTLKTASAVKFLRDTAENTLQYLQNKNTDPIMMAELNATYDMAKTTAVTLTGGKKRKFDISEAEKIKGTPRGPSQIQTKRKDNGRCKDDYKRPNVGPVYRRVEYAGDHGRRFEHESSGYPRIRGSGGHRDAPLGYTRTVDSYQSY